MQNRKWKKKKRKIIYGKILTHEEESGIITLKRSKNVCWKDSNNIT